MDIQQVDPELRDATLNLQGGDASNVEARKAMRAAIRVMPVPRFDNVAVTTQRAGDVRMRVYTPRAATHPGALLWIHGGGFLIGDARQDETLCAETAADLGIRVFSANYRLAPEHPFPAALEDVGHVWRWLLGNAQDLGIDPSRVAIGGESAGAGLAASLVQFIRDTDGPQPIAQWLFAPMIDDRTAADHSLDQIGHFIWDNTANRIGWGSYLGFEPGTVTPPEYAAAARRTALRGLPQTFIAVGDIELFLDEDRTYAESLRASGVSVELQIVPGAPHGFENWSHGTVLAETLKRSARNWLRSALADDTDVAADSRP